MNPFISIIIPIRNESKYITACLNSVLAQDYPVELVEILVADGMSTDTSRYMIKDIASRNLQTPIVIIDNPAMIVPAGMNLALQQAKGEIIIRVDGHCIIAPDYVRNCVKHIQNDGVDGVGGPMTSIGETSLSSAIAIGMSSFFGVGDSAFRTISGKTMLADTVPFPAYTRRMIDLAGRYDEELVRNQDDEYNYRIREIGGKVLLADDVRSTYFSRTTLKHLFRQYYQYGFWKVRVLQKHPRQMSLRQFIPPLFVLSIIASLAAAFIPPIRLLSLLIPGAYITANLTASFYTAARRSLQSLPLLPLVFAILHISYGLGFLAGLLKFWPRFFHSSQK